MAVQSKTGLNDIFDLLTHPHRRYLLYHLTQESETVDLDTLVAILANRDAGQLGESRNTSSDTIEMEFRHMHLPKLADAGVITFDADTGIIELTETNGHSQFIAEAARVDGYTEPIAGD